MNRIIRTGITAILIIILIFSIIAISTVNAAASAQADKKSGIGHKERELISRLSVSDYDQTRYDRAMATLESLKQQAWSDIEASICQQSNGDIQPFTLDTVYLGTDRTFSNADRGDKGISNSGLAPLWIGCNYDYGSKKDTAATLIGPGGWGGGTAWSWVGKEFYVSGSGSRTANIYITGHYYGLLSAAAGGASDVTIRLVVKDQSNGQQMYTTIYQDHEFGWGWSEVNNNINQGININLQAGHSYIVYLELVTSATVAGAGEGGSDFGPDDGDYNGEGAWYSSITIDF